MNLVKSPYRRGLVEFVEDLYFVTVLGGTKEVYFRVSQYQCTKTVDHEGKPTYWFTAQYSTLGTDLTINAQTNAKKRLPIHIIYYIDSPKSENARETVNSVS